jgi:hypothetical protein
LVQLYGRAAMPWAYTAAAAAAAMHLATLLASGAAAKVETLVMEAEEFAPAGAVSCWTRQNFTQVIERLRRPQAGGLCGGTPLFFCVGLALVCFSAELFLLGVRRPGLGHGLHIPLPQGIPRCAGRGAPRPTLRRDVRGHGAGWPLRAAGPRQRSSFSSLK